MTCVTFLHGPHFDLTCLHNSEIVRDFPNKFYQFMKGSITYYFQQKLSATAVTFDIFQMK
jgi:hypothetical protein